MREIHRLEKDEANKTKIEQEVNELIKQRNNLDGKLNLYIIAERSIRENQKDKVPCPLCTTGYVTYKEILKNLKDQREKRATLNSKILELNQQKQNMIIFLRNAREELRPDPYFIHRRGWPAIRRCCRA